MDSLHDRLAPPATPAEAELRLARDRSDREVAAGLTVPVADVLAELDRAVLQMEARRPARRA